MLYLVYGPKEGSEESMRAAHNVLVKKFGTDVVYSCIETGISRSHYHLNVILDKDARTDSVRRTFRSIMSFPEELYHTAEDRYTFVVKTVTDLPRLVSGYLRKEDSVILLHNALDLALLARELEQREEEFASATRTVVSHLNVVSEQEVITMAVSYFSNPRVLFNNPSFRHFQQQFVLNKYYCSRISWRRVFNYCLIHSRSEALLDAEEMPFPDLWEI